MHDRHFWYLGKNAPRGKPIKVLAMVCNYGFNYVDDCVNALLLAGASEQANGKVYNLGSPEVIGLKTLAEKIVSLGFGGSYELVPFPEERKAIDIGDYYSDFSLISMELGWLPEVNLQKGLWNTIEYYSKHKSAYWGEM